MTANEYRSIIAAGFSSKEALNAFIDMIAEDQSLSYRAYEALRREAIDKFYLN